MQPKKNRTRDRRKKVTYCVKLYRLIHANARSRPMTMLYPARPQNLKWLIVKRTKLVIISMLLIPERGATFCGRQVGTFFYHNLRTSTVLRRLGILARSEKIIFSSAKEGLAFHGLHLGRILACANKRWNHWFFGGGH